ncbi:MAG: lysine--tRNA ligase [Candidatus Vogelbacteria bacterium]|nr:lysine--tRNA ligase [Candidatus Vogelbacteria bacterium]
MASLDEIRQERIGKLQKLKAAGLDPYPIESRRDHELAEVARKFAILSKRQKPIHLVGRVRAIRGQGAISFVDLDDGTGKLQALFKSGPSNKLRANDLDEAQFKLFSETVDIGDFIEVAGTLFVTKRKEKTILVSGWRMLAKSLRPLPDKWHGLQDVEERFRRRYLDTLMAPEVKERFVLRSRLISAIREFLDQADFLEVETPMLQPLAGGATAKPFVTHHQALDIDLYLRVAPELYLKEMLIGGFSKVYELGRSFRNEGIDATHNPEFTSIEAYAAYSTPVEQRALVEKLFKTVVKKVFGQTLPKFVVVTFADLLKKHTLIADLGAISDKDLQLKANQFGIKVEPHEDREKILDNIYKKLCRPKLIEPTFIIDYPAACSPLAKHRANKPELIDRFQLVMSGVELVNGFAELNDPLDQRERFSEQEKKRQGGDEEAQPKDEAYLEAMEYGLPPACGWGLGIDRLLMLLTGTRNIKEVIFFPTLKPRE